DGIGLGEVGIDYTRKGITTDASMRTNVKSIYAIGDVTGNYMLAHVATKEALVAVETIAGRSASIDYMLVPRCVYTNPEYAAVGRTEQEAREQGYDVRVSRVRLGRIGRALTMGETFGLAKMVIDNSTSQLLGLQILAPHASEFITEATLALQQEASLEALASAIHPHPTLSEIVWETAQSALGKSIHGEDTS
ncbi:MAG TPA: dihydrolipoyl dehydrogenase, partial [Firmicutes bacterium]|nr:dihydrolipoyl dehydrogenase [Bacillota bacterium]